MCVRHIIYIYIYIILRFLLSICVCVRDGCRRGCNEFAGRVQNNHVLLSFYRNGHNLIFFSKKLLQVWTLCIAGYMKDTIVACWTRMRHDFLLHVTACSTSDGQEHKIIWRAGPERDTIFHVHVTACREQGSHCHD